MNQRDQSPGGQDWSSARAIHSPELTDEVLSGWVGAPRQM